MLHGQQDGCHHGALRAATDTLLPGIATVTCLGLCKEMLKRLSSAPTAAQEQRARTLTAASRIMQTIENKRASALHLVRCTWEKAQTPSNGPCSAHMDVKYEMVLSQPSYDHSPELGSCKQHQPLLSCARCSLL